MTDVKESSQSTATPLVFRQTPRALLSMAALELALLCWRNEIINLYPDEVDCLWHFWLTTHKFTSNDIFRVPNPIVNWIDCHIKQFGEVLENLIVNHLPACMSNYGDLKPKVILNVLKNIVFEPCGIIIDVKTIRKLVTGDIFDPIDQFELACEYSLEVDIERLWPLVSDHMAIRNYTLDRAKCYYWRCRMRNELDTITGDEQHSAEFRLISYNNFKICQSWTDVEFFWHKFKTHEQISELILDTFLKERVPHYLLSKLNPTQLEYVLTRMPCDIMKNLPKYDGTFEYTLETWNFMKNLITGHQFFIILRNLSQEAYYSYRDWYEKRVDLLLYQIWLEAPPNLKNYVLDNHVGNIFNNLETKCSIQNYDTDLRFFRCLLTSTRFEVRNGLWLKNWPKFILIAKPDDFDELVKLCFDDTVEFKKQVALDFKRLRFHFLIFVEFGLSRELFDYFKYFCLDENCTVLRGKIIECVLPRIIDEYRFRDSSSVIKFVTNFIDDNYLAYGVSSELIFADEFKVRFIRDNLSAFIKMIDQNELTYVKNVIDCFLSSNKKYLAEVKQSLYEKYLQILRSGYFNITRMREWNAFLKWCVPSQQEFRNALPVEHIFQRLLTEIIREIRESDGVKLSDGEEYNHAVQIKRMYRTLINFFRWYFEQDVTKRDKLNEFGSYCDVDMIIKMLREANDSLIFNIVNWYFDEDVEKIEQFRSRVTDK